MLRRFSQNFIFPFTSEWKGTGLIKHSGQCTFKEILNNLNFKLVWNSVWKCDKLHVTFFGKMDTNAFPLNGQEKRS